MMYNILVFVPFKIMDYIAEIDKMSKKMKEVQKNNICVVSEDYLDDVQKGGGLVKIMAHKISSWGDIVREHVCVLACLCTWVLVIAEHYVHYELSIETRQVWTATTAEAAATADLSG